MNDLTKIKCIRKPLVVPSDRVRVRVRIRARARARRAVHRLRGLLEGLKDNFV